VTTLQLPRRVTVVEVGPRDGLQNEAVRVPTAVKIAFVEALAAAGLPVVEITAFVNPNRVPQMADAGEVARGVARRDGVRYTALVPNMRGLAAARQAGLTEVAVFAAASETFSRRNINQSIDESLAAYRDVVAEAGGSGMRVRGYLSTAFGCPFEGEVAVAAVAGMAARLLDLGVFEIAVSDTIGVATPGQVVDVVEAVAARVPREAIALHFHDTRGTALANVLAALQAGITTFDASAGGLGGCPFAPGAAGNVATEDLLYMLHGLGIETGVDLDAVAEASRAVARALNHPLASRYVAAGPARPA
jgi:isopropylmalate/homocitrate/citramalate synthase